MRNIVNKKVYEFLADPDSLLSESVEDLLRDIESASAEHVAKLVVYFVATHGLNQILRIPLERMLELIYGGGVPESTEEVATIVSSAIRLDKLDYSILGGSRVLDFWDDLPLEDKLCVVAGIPDIVFSALRKHTSSLSEAEALILAIISHFKSVLMVD